MKTDTVELPVLERAEGGWVLYEPRADSICPQHQFCAYSGDESWLCGVCHASSHATKEHGDLPPHQSAPCLCGKCGELFTSITSFDQHQRPAGVCRNPGKRGLVLITKKDRYGTVWNLWGKPGSRPDL